MGDPDGHRLEDRRVEERHGLVLFVFTEPRMARLDVGYGLEAVITDARARQLLETHLAPAFAAGQYERGFDALIFGIRKEIGGDDADSIHARAAEARKRDDVPWTTTVANAFQRTPRMISATTRNFLEGGTEERLAILMFVAVGLGIAAMGVAVAANTVWRVAQLPAACARAAPARPGPSLGKVAYEIVMGVFAVRHLLRHDHDRPPLRRRILHAAGALQRRRIGDRLARLVAMKLNRTRAA